MNKQEETRRIALDFAESVVAISSSGMENQQGLSIQLQDLKLEIVKKGAELAGINPQSVNVMDQIWLFAQKMPDFSIDKSYTVYLAPISLFAAIISGWLLGGLLSGLLDYFSMGGEILKPLLIFIIVWLEQYLVCNAKARNRLLKYLGLLGLSAYAARMGLGLLRFGTGFKSFLGKGTGFFKSIWLFLGALVIMTFFKGKALNINTDAVKMELAGKIEAWLNFFLVVFQQWSLQEKRIHALEEKNNNPELSLNQINELGGALFQILDALDPPIRAFIEGKLKKQGFERFNADSNFIVWENERDSKLYESQGFINNGDNAVILRKPWKNGGEIKKGLVRRQVQEVSR